MFVDTAASVCVCMSVLRQNVVLDDGATMLTPTQIDDQMRHVVSSVFTPVSASGSTVGTLASQQLQDPLPLPATGVSRVCQVASGTYLSPSLYPMLATLCQSGSSRRFASH